MPARPEDDFSPFQGHEHMFFDLKDPLGLMRQELESLLRRQRPDAELLSIATLAEPKFLTLGRKAGAGEQLVVTHFAFCARLRLTVLFDEQRKGELLEVTLTFAFGDVDRAGAQRFRSHFDVHADADAHFDDAVFKQRFLAFRQG